MMRPLFALAALTLTPLVPAQADPFLVVPGRSVGQTHLGKNGAEDLKRLPRPDGGDAAMGGRRMMVWKSRATGNTLAVFAVARGFLDPPQPGLTLGDIRVTSAKFHTVNGAASGATLAQIKCLYPSGRLKPANDRASWFYTVSQGIAFEFRPHPGPATRSLSLTVFLAGGTGMGRVDLMTRQEVQDLLKAGAH